MNHSIIYIFVLFLFSCNGEPQKKLEEEEASTASKTYQLVWQDEFDADGTPDSEKWGFEHGFIRNREKQYYTARSKNTRVSEDVLIIEAHKEEIKNESFIASDSKKWKENQEYAHYTAASLTTKDLAQWTYGKIEVSAKLPKGIGLWPAIWMLGENWKEVGWPLCGEIDIMEHVGFTKDSIFGTVHTEAFNHTKGTEVGKSVFIANPYTEFHDYAVEWTPQRIVFLLDGLKYHEFVNTNKDEEEWPFDQPFHLKLNIAVGGDWGGQRGIDDTIFPQQMLIDYVRVYQLK
ncbi:family 16 glycosylhydrolase [Maribacter sp. 2210JD10-5]|uniref:glycoside hydrolase family 16 protein n=1 Tax=Maribacter sp. 2210JD10-5 TaxID=3386272 RepID=UPI0039BC4392